MSFSCDERADSFSASWSLSSFSLLKNSSLSSLSRLKVDGVSGLPSINEGRSPAGVPALLRVGVPIDPGVGGTGLGALRALRPPGVFIASATDGAHFSESTLPPARHVFTSSSSAAACSRTAANSATVFLSIALSSAGDISTLTRALFLIDLALMPNRKVDNVSGSL